MNDEVLVIIPVLGRPEAVPRLLRSLQESAGERVLHPLFMVSPGDDEELRAINAAGADRVIVPWEPGPGDFSRKTNLAIRETDNEWILSAADDLVFHPGWADEAIRVSVARRKRFVATNDLANPLVIRGQHATHPLVHRSYVEELGTWDEPGKLYHEGYSHQCVDVEASDTAKVRGEFVAATRSVVEHMHPIYRKEVKMDETYRKALADGATDRDLLLRRMHLWGASPNRSRSRQ